MLQDKHQFKLRIPAGLKQWVDSQAYMNRRTKNSEILKLIEEAKQIREQKEQINDRSNH